MDWQLAALLLEVAWIVFVALWIAAERRPPQVIDQAKEIAGLKVSLK